MFLTPAAGMVVSWWRCCTGASANMDEDPREAWSWLRKTVEDVRRETARVVVGQQEVVEQMLLIERLICTPPKIGETLHEKKIVSIEAQISLKQAILLISRFSERAPVGQTFMQAGFSQCWHWMGRYVRDRLG